MSTASPPASPSPGDPAAARWRTPLVVVAAGCLISLVGFGVRSAFGLFLEPMTLAQGWSRETFALAMAIQNLFWGLGLPFAGMLADRFGAPKVLAGGALVYAAGVFGMAEADSGLALQLTGGPDSDPAPEGRNTYAWVMESDRADLFLTYCTNAVLARRESPDLQIVQVPQALSVAADYGLVVLDGAPDAAWRLAFHILSPAGQAVLAEYGFDAPGLPKE